MIVNILRLEKAGWFLMGFSFVETVDTLFLYKGKEQNPYSNLYKAL